MSVPSDELARRLTEEFEARAQPAAVLDPNARDALFHEFRIRLRAAPNPDQLADRWRQNADRYIERAIGRNRSQTGPASIDVAWVAGIWPAQGAPVGTPITVERIAPDGNLLVVRRRGTRTEVLAGDEDGRLFWTPINPTASRP